jgi:hypothetical protein
MTGKGTILGYIFTVTTHKFEITTIILTTNIFLMWRVQLKETGCQGVSK